MSPKKQLRHGSALSTYNKFFKVTFQIIANSSLDRSYFSPDRNSALAETDGSINSFRISGQLEMPAVSALPAQIDSLGLTHGDQSFVEASDVLYVCSSTAHLLGRQVWHCPAVGNSHHMNRPPYPQRQDWERS